MRYLSPLRYPGGKARLAPYLASLIRQQQPRPTIYAEPFAGGAGAALRLLIDEEVDVICLNDLNVGIAAFWRSVLNDTRELSELIRLKPVNLTSWEEARDVYLHPEGRDDLELGFATLLLNRCNRSGILTARPIGGLDQSGRWKIDARFNREALVNRVETIGRYRTRVKVTQADAREFIAALDKDADVANLLVYVDPPYLGQGDGLYLNSLTLGDHRELAEILRECELRWLLTYDVDMRVTEELYPGFRCVAFDIAHTAQRQHVGEEYAVFSHSLTLAADRLLPSGDERWIMAAP